MLPKGYLSMVLHTHLPFVRHPEHDYFLEENWLYEAITETYLPLLDIYFNLIKNHVDFQITMSLTPPLISMMMDSLLQERYVRYITLLIELSGKEIERTKLHQKEMLQNAKMYHKHFKRCLYLFEKKFKRNMIGAFKTLQDLGVLEIITCPATHGFLPNMQVNLPSVKAQIKIAVMHYKDVFQRQPRGIWLAECGYYPGLETILKDNGISYFFTDTHAMLYGEPRPKYGVYAPCYCENGVAFFARDSESSKSVWSSEEGYPGDVDYRDFYRDIGFDLDLGYIKPYIHPDGIRVFTGIKYYRITGKTDDKKPYHRKNAMEKAASHAGNFMFNREKQAEYLYDLFNEKSPIIISPYDAELYGHWWFEGPQFLDFLFRKIHFDQHTIKTITPSAYLSQFSKNQLVKPTMSSWGYKGYSEVWLEGSNDWIYKHLYVIASRMTELADTIIKPTDIELKILNQAARELLLAQSSDWAFIMKTGTTVEYAKKRTILHINRFLALYDQLKKKQIDFPFLKMMESQDNIFPNIDYQVYRTDHQP